MSLIGYTTTTYKEDRRPAEDASNVGRWIIAPAILASGLGAAMFGGWAGVLPVFFVAFVMDDPAGSLGMMGYSFVFSSLLFGGGFVGLLMMFVRVATYDKKPFISIRETVQEPVREEPKKQPIRGNNSVSHVQPNGTVTVEYKNSKHEFQRTQIKAMLDRLDDENYQVGRDAFGITPEEYSGVCEIMAGLEYWRVWKRGGKISRVELLDDGAEWLRKVSR
jgi:hypothetical protein